MGLTIHHQNLEHLEAEGAAPAPDIDAEIAKAEKGDPQALAFLYDHYSKTSHGPNCSYRCKGECDCEKADIAQVLEANGRDVP
jgi:hypothetical protein